MKLLLLLCLSLAATTRGQGDFQVYSGTENLIEGSRVDTLTVVSGNQQFKLRPPPRSWSHQEDNSGRKIIFTDQSGRSALTLQFTASSPGKLPGDDILQAQALQAHPGAQLVQKAVCPTGYQPGVLFDLVRVPAPGIVQRIRHAFVAQPAGQVEFVLVASDDEFGKGKLAITDMLGSFHVAPPKPKGP